jgi:adenylate cyclase
MTVPASLMLEDKEIVVESSFTSTDDMQSLAQQTLLPDPRQDTSLPRASGLTNLSLPDAESLIHWLQTVTAVLHSAGTSSDFFQRAAQAMVDLVGLDSGRVMLLRDGQWQEAAHSRGHQRKADDSQWRASARMLARMAEEKRTVWRTPSQLVSSGASLASIQWVVASPILDRAGNVLGALYGDRLQRAGTESGGITRLEAMLTETLAVSVATGLARLAQEEAALKAHVLLEQFFGPDLAQLLETRPDLLEHRDAEVTVLFCDVRHFSRIAERVGPAATVELVRDTLGEMSECVIQHGGGLVDYVGDELMAMWGAPVEQADHAARSCRAALDMLGRLPRLNERWQVRMGEPLEVGIGVNTGPARVGDVGSKLKFKYGPLGNTNNVASRVQGATKFFKTELLVSAATHALLSADFPTRRICRVRVVNIHEPVDLYQVAPPEAEAWPRLRDEYEAALEAFERRDFATAVKTLGRLLGDYPDDGPSLTLMARVMQSRGLSPEHFDPVWELPGK